MTQNREIKERAASESAREIFKLILCQTRVKVHSTQIATHPTFLLLAHTLPLSCAESGFRQQQRLDQAAAGAAGLPAVPAVREDGAGERECWCRRKEEGMGHAMGEAED